MRTVDVMLDRKSIGYRVYIARMEARMQTVELADLCDISDVHMRHIENGTRAPSLETLVAICNALHVSPAYFLASELDIHMDDPVDTAIKTVGDCSPREANMILAMLAEARKHLQDKNIGRKPE